MLPAATRFKPGPRLGTRQNADDASGKGGQWVCPCSSSIGTRIDCLQHGLNNIDMISIHSSPVQKQQEGQQKRCVEVDLEATLLCEAHFGLSAIKPFDLAAMNAKKASPLSIG